MVTAQRPQVMVKISSRNQNEQWKFFEFYCVESYQQPATSACTTKCSGLPGLRHRRDGEARAGSLGEPQASRASAAGPLALARREEPGQGRALLQSLSTVPHGQAACGDAVNAPPSCWSHLGITAAWVLWLPNWSLELSDGVLAGL